MTWAVSWSKLRPTQHHHHHHYSTTVYSSSCMGGLELLHLGIFTWYSQCQQQYWWCIIIIISTDLFTCHLYVGGNVTSWDFITGTNWIMSRIEFLLNHIHTGCPTMGWLKIWEPEVIRKVCFCSHHKIYHQNRPKNLTRPWTELDEGLRKLEDWCKIF